MKNVLQLSKKTLATIALAAALASPFSVPKAFGIGVEDANQKVSTSTSKLEADEKELSEMRDLVAVLKEKVLPELRAQKALMEQQIAELEAKIYKLETQVANDREALKAARQELEDMMQRFQGYLSDMNPVSARADWGAVEHDRSADWHQAPRDAHLRIGGTAYAKGLSANTNSSIVYNLHGFSREFHAVVGIDDTYKTKGNRYKPHTVFIVKGDGVELARVPVTAEQAVSIDLKIEGVTLLELDAVHTDTGRFNHADWAMVRVSR